MSLPYSKGDSSAFTMAFSTLRSPLARPMAIMAPPPLRIVLSTSRKSRLILPSNVINSEMLLTALHSIWSAALNACFKASSESEYTSHMLSLLMIRSESTFLRISSTPFSAFMILFFFSKKKGMVTMPMVRMPIPCATEAMIGAAPVPVPPPIPAVTKHILVLSSKSRFTCSLVFSASCLPSSGSEPAPSPLSPRRTFTGIGELDSDWLSVLQTAKDTLAMPSSAMFLTALQPPPPTPTTLIICFEVSSTGPKSKPV